MSVSVMKFLTVSKKSGSYLVYIEGNDTTDLWGSTWEKWLSPTTKFYS